MHELKLIRIKKHNKENSCAKWVSEWVSIFSKIPDGKQEIPVKYVQAHSRATN